jgi:hypothetical protein
MAILKTIFNSSPFHAVCQFIGYLSFSCLAFFVACFVCTLVADASIERQKIIESAMSPDGKLKAVVYEHIYQIGHYRNINVSVIDADSQPERERDGNLFSFTDASAKVRWVDDQHVQILHTGKTWRSTPFTFIAFDGRSLNVESVSLKDNSN